MCNTFRDIIRYFSTVTLASENPVYNILHAHACTYTCTQDTHTHPYTHTHTHTHTHTARMQPNI